MSPVRLPPILFEDESLIAFDKPAGLLVAPDRWDKRRENLMTTVHERLGRQVANAHRLDADTSGVLLCAKTKPALDFVTGQFQAKAVEKVYLALAVVLPVERAMKVAAPIRDEAGGLPAEFSVELAIGPDERQPGRMRLHRRQGGKPSRTDFRLLEGFGRFAWVECRPATGRTHQIRIHLASAGAPVLGDRFYGDPEVRLLLSELKRRYKGRERERPLIGRLALHSSRLRLFHPNTREPVAIEAPLPSEFAVALKYLRRFSGARHPFGGAQPPEGPAGS
ncbi:MAG: RluA family pseudouridine synthase [Opitutaceae bacterium]